MHVQIIIGGSKSKDFIKKLPSLFLVNISSCKVLCAWVFFQIMLYMGFLSIVV